MVDYPVGSDPYTARQYLLHHMYSPLVSVDASPNADLMVQSLLNCDVSVLQVLKPYGNNAKYHIPAQVFKITNTQLISKNYPSFPVRFEPSLPDLLSITHATNSDSRLHQLFSITSLESLLRSASESSDQDLYLYFFNKIITSNTIVPFETFNHPIAQIFVIDFHTDSIAGLRKMIVDFRNSAFPKYFQIEDLLVHAFILYDPTMVSADELVQFQDQIRKSLAINSSVLATVSQEPAGDAVRIFRNESSTIDEDLQRISLEKSSNKILDEDRDYINVPKFFDTIIKTRMFEFINNQLIPHMEKRIRQWDDQVLAPKKSITGRFFSVSRKLFNNDSSAANNAGTGSHFNSQENYYSKSAPEQVIRKLADWCLILKDFRYAYATYDLIKKDYTNDKAWVYVASTQEMSVISMLLVQTQQIGSSAQPPDKNTLRKIRHDIVEPYLDNLSYTYKSRLNLKTYNLRTVLSVVELLLCMCSTYDLSWWWNDLIEKYLAKCIADFDNHLTSANQKSQVIKAILYERLGYSFGRCAAWQGADEPDQPGEPEEEGMYVNPHKIPPGHSSSKPELKRYRKSSLWYLLSMREWMALKNYSHTNELLENVKHTYNISQITDNWYDREDLLLGSIKRVVLDNNTPA